VGCSFGSFNASFCKGETEENKKGMKYDISLIFFLGTWWLGSFCVGGSFLDSFFTIDVWCVFGTSGVVGFVGWK